MTNTLANETATVEDYESACRDEERFTDELLAIHDRSRIAQSDFRTAMEAGDEVGMHEAITRWRACNTTMSELTAGIQRAGVRKMAAKAARAAHAHVESVRQRATAARLRSCARETPRMDVNRNTRVRRVVRVVAKTAAKACADPDGPPRSRALRSSAGGAA